MNKDILDGARKVAQESAAAITSAVDPGVEICGVAMAPLSAGRLMVLEALESAVLSEKPPSQMKVIEEVVMALWVLSANPNEYASVYRYSNARRNYLDSLAIIGDDPKVSGLYSAFCDAESDMRGTIAMFADSLPPFDASATYGEIVSFINDQFCMFQLRSAQKKTRSPMSRRDSDGTGAMRSS